LVDLQITVEKTQLATDDIYNVEEAVTSYFRDLITQDESLRFLNDPKNVLNVAVSIKKQTVDENQVFLKGDIDVMHYGDQGIIDLAALLTFLVNKNNTNSSYVYMDHLIGMGATVEYVEFDFVSESVPLSSNLTLVSEYNKNVTSSGRSSNEKILIVVVTLLSITLIALASIICWIGGGWLALRRQVSVLLQREEELTRNTQQKGIHPKGTEETEDDGELSPSPDTKTNFTNPSGILGVYGMNGDGGDKLKGLGIKTPARTYSGEMYDNYLATPMSTYSDTDRAPIGIMSMRKLVGSHVLMPGRDENNDDDSSEGENVEKEGDHENFRMEKLEY
jgi:hypothetical protein